MEPQKPYNSANSRSPQQSQNFDFTRLVRVAKRHWKVFAVVVVVSALVGVIISMPAFMTSKYKSTAVVYPTNIEAYSDESETEQLLQYFEAGSVRDSIIEKFNLYEVYGIDPSAPSARYYLLQEYNDNFVTGKTAYESVLLEVSNEDPQLAKKMADEVLRQVNLKFNDVVHQRSLRKAESYRKQMAYQASVLDSLENLIAEVSTENRVLEYGSQTRELVRGYVNALSSNQTADLDKIETWLEETQAKGSLLRMLQNLSYMGTAQYNEINRGYMEYRELAYSDLNYMDVVVEPEVSDKKYWPVRWLIVVLCVVVGVLMTFVVLGLMRP